MSTNEVLGQKFVTTATGNLVRMCRGNEERIFFPPQLLEVTESGHARIVQRRSLTAADLASSKHLQGLIEESTDFHKSFCQCKGKNCQTLDREISDIKARKKELTEEEQGIQPIPVSADKVEQIKAMVLERDQLEAAVKERNTKIQQIVESVFKKA